jgi:HEPN domain-containing protein
VSKNVGARHARVLRQFLTNYLALSPKLGYNRIVTGLKKTTLNWIASAKYDFESAQHMFNTKRYIHVIFFCHLAIEKMLKAIIAESQDRHPPYTHDLYELIRRANLAIPKAYQPTIAKLNQLSVVTRYPEDLEQLVASYPRSVVQEFLRQSRAILKWLERDPRLKPS